MRFSRFIPVAFAAMAALPAVSSAQVSVLNVNPKNPFGNTVKIGTAQNNAFVGPYLSQINNGPTWDVFCIDADHPFKVSDSNNLPYQAYVLTFDDIVSNATNGTAGITNLQALRRVLGTTAQFGGTTIANTATDYLGRLKTESALTDLFGNLSSPSTNWDEIHYAIWGVFSSTQTLLPDAGIGTGAGQSEFYYNQAAATAATAGYDYSDWRIILDARAWDEIDGGVYRQALITSTVPEPGTYALVGFGLLGLFGAARRRKLAAKK